MEQEVLIALDYRGKIISIIFRLDDEGYYAGRDIIYQRSVLTRMSSDDAATLGFLPADMDIINAAADAHLAANADTLPQREGV